MPSMTQINAYGFNYYILNLTGNSQLGGNNVNAADEGKLNLTDGLSSYEMQQIDKNKDGVITEKEYIEAAKKQGVDNARTYYENCLLALGSNFHVTNNGRKVEQKIGNDETVVTEFSLSGSVISSTTVKNVGETTVTTKKSQYGTITETTKVGNTTTIKVTNKNGEITTTKLENGEVKERLFQKNANDEGKYISCTIEEPDTNGNTIKTTYNSNGKITKKVITVGDNDETYPKGTIIIKAFSSNRLSSETINYPEGARLKSEEKIFNYKGEVTKTITINTDGSSKTESISSKDTKITTEKNKDGKTTLVTVERGNEIESKTSYDYDNNGKLQLITVKDGKNNVTGYKSGTVTIINDETEVQTQTTYNAWGEISKVVTKNQETNTTETFIRGVLTGMKIEYLNGIDELKSEEEIYNSKGILTKRIETYTDDSSKTVSISSNGTTTTTEKNQNGKPTKVVVEKQDELVKQTDYDYDDNGKLKLITTKDENNNITYKSGVVETKDENGNTVETTYDKNGKITSAVVTVGNSNKPYQKGTIITTTFSGGKLSKQRIDYPEGATLKSEEVIFNHKGEITKTIKTNTDDSSITESISSNGTITNTEKDKDGKTTQVIVIKGETVESTSTYEYYADGKKLKLITIKDGNGNVTGYKSGTLTTTENGTEVQTTYDANGKITKKVETITDENGNKVEKTYNAENILIKEVTKEQTDNEIKTTTLKYQNGTLATKEIVTTSDINSQTKEIINYDKDEKETKHTITINTFNDDNTVTTEEQQLEPNKETILKKTKITKNNNDEIIEHIIEEKGNTIYPIYKLDENNAILNTKYDSDYKIINQTISMGIFDTPVIGTWMEPWKVETI